MLELSIGGLGQAKTWGKGWEETERSGLEKAAARWHGVILPPVAHRASAEEAPMRLPAWDFLGDTLSMLGQIALVLYLLTFPSVADDSAPWLTHDALRVTRVGTLREAMDQWRHSIEAAGDADAVLARWRPVDDEDTAAWARYGLACEALRRREEAVAAYEHVLAHRPAHHGVRMRWFLLREGARAKDLEPLGLVEFSHVAKVIGESWEASARGPLLAFLDSAAQPGRERAQLQPLCRLLLELEGDLEVAEAMLRVPSLAEAAFAWWSSTRGDGEDLLGHAVIALRAQCRCLRSFRNREMSWHGARSPASVVLTQALKDADWLEDEILPSLRKEGHPRRVAAFESLRELYGVPEGQFMNAALAYVERRGEEGLEEVIGARSARRLSQFAERNEGGVGAWLESLARVIEMDQESPRELFLAMIRKVSADPENFWDCLEYVDTVLEPRFPDERVRERTIDWGSHPLLQSDTYQDLLGSIKLLRASPFLRDVDAFRTYAWDEGRHSLLASVLQRIRQLSAGKRRHYEVMLAEEEPTFGRDLLAACLAEMPAEALLDVLCQHQTALENAPETCLREVGYEWTRVLEMQEGFEVPSKQCAFLDGLLVSSAIDVETFLGSADLNLLGWTPERSRLRVRHWVRSLAHGDRAQARQVYEKALAWWTEGLEPQEASRLASAFLHQLVEGSRSVAVADFCAGIIADPQATTPTWWMDPMAHVPAFFAPIDETDEDWERQLSVFFEGAAKGLQGRGTIVIMLEGLWLGIESLAYGNRERFEEMVSWLESDLFTGRHPELAHWCRALALLHRDRLNEVVDLTTVWQRLREPFDDPGLSLPGQLAYAESLARLVGKRLPDDVLERIAQVSEKGLVSGVVPERQLHTISTTLAGTGVRAGGLAATWVQTASESADAKVALIMFEVAIQSGDDEVIDAIAAEADLDFDWLLLLLRAKDWQRATAWIQDDWKRFDWRHGVRKGALPVFEPAVAEALPALTETLKADRELGFLLEALLSALPDEGEESMRRERLRSLAKRVRSHVWIDRDQERGMLAFISAEAQAAHLLVDNYREVAGKWSLKEMPSLTEVRARRAWQAVFQMALRLSLHRGHERYEALLTALLQTQEDERKEVQGWVLENLQRAFLEDWASWGPEILRQHEKLVPLAADLDAEHWLPLGWAIRTLIGDADATYLFPARVRRAKPRRGESETPSARFLRNVVAHLGTAMQGVEVPKERKEAIAIALCQSTGFTMALRHVPVWEEGWFGLVQRRGWIREETLLNEGRAFAKAAPRRGWAWKEMADRLTLANEPEDALACWREAAKIAGNDSKRYSVFELGKIQQLLDLNLNVEANRALTFFDAKRLHPDHKEQLEALRKRAKQRADRGTTTV